MFRFMPPSMPIAGIPRIAVVFARLMVGDDDRGIRPFIVALGDGKKMCNGVTSTCVRGKTPKYYFNPTKYAQITPSHRLWTNSGPLHHLVQPSPPPINGHVRQSQKAR